MTAKGPSSGVLRDFKQALSPFGDVLFVLYQCRQKLGGFCGGVRVAQDGIKSVVGFLCGFGTEVCRFKSGIQFSLSNAVFFRRSEERRVGKECL